MNHHVKHPCKPSKQRDQTPCSKLWIVVVLAQLLAANLLLGSETDTIIPNASFEKEGEWTRKTWTGKADLARDGTVAHTGVFSAKINQTEEGRSAFFSNEIPIEGLLAEGKTFTFSAWFKTSGAINTWLDIYFYPSGDHFGTLRVNGQDWLEKKAYRTAPEGTKTFRLYLAAEGKGAAWVDDVKIVRGSPVLLVPDKNNRIKLGKQIEAQVLTKNDHYSIYIRDALQKVFKYDRLKSSHIDNTIRISAAKNEYEPFQVVFLSDGNIDGRLSLEFEDLISNQEGKINKTNIKYNPEHYIYLPAVSDMLPECCLTKDATGPGDYPDPLLETQEIKITKSNESANYPIWVTCYVPRDTPAGDYAGQILFKLDGKLITKSTLCLRVHDFALPAFTHLDISCGLTFERWKDKRNLSVICRDWYKNLAEHRVNMLTRLWPEPKFRFEGGNVVLDSAEFDEMAHYCLDELGFTAFFMPNIGFCPFPKGNVIDTAKWYGIKVANKDCELTDEFIDKFGKYLTAMSKHLEEKGWLDKVYIGIIDEPHSEKDVLFIKHIVPIIRKASPKIRIYATEQPLPQLYGLIDVWCPCYYEKDKFQARQKLGEKIWCYNNSYSMMDYSLINTRMFPWIMWKYDINGQLIYVGGTAGDPWKEPWDLYPDCRVSVANGLWLYPNPVGLGDDYENLRWDLRKNGEGGPPINSIRWEVMREGLDDYEYLWLLRERLRQANELKLSPIQEKQVAEIAQYLRQITDEMVLEYYNPSSGGKFKMEFNKDPGKVYMHREKIAGYIVELGKMLLELSGKRKN